MKKLFCSLIFFLFLVSTVSAYAIVVHPLDASGNEVPLTVFDYRFEFSNDSTCTNVIFSHDETIETSESGIAVIQIDTSNITQIPKYICEYKNLVLRTVHNVSDQFFDTVYADTINLTNNITANEGFLKLNYSWLQNVPDYMLNSSISLQNLISESNVTIQDTLTFRLGEIIDNIIDGIIRITGDLNVTGLIYGNGSQLTGITGDNSSWNETYATSIYAPVNYGDDWNKTYADTLYSNDTDTDTNASTACDTTEVLLGNGTCYNSTLFYDGSGDDASWNKTYADTLYATISEIVGFGYYNSTDFSITDYSLTSALVGLLGNWSADKGDYSTTTEADNLYAPVNYGDDWNKTYADTLYSTTGDNSSWNETYADTLYIEVGEEGNLDVNSSDYWDDIGTINATQMEDNGGTLNILVSWLDSLYCRITGCNITGNLSIDGDLNVSGLIYGNGSQLTGIPSGNESFNQSLTDELYAKYQFQNNNFNGSGNFTTTGSFIGDGSQLTNVNVSDEYAKYQFTDNNFNGSGNFTTSGDGFFRYLGSLLNRITTLFVQDIYLNGTLQVNSGLIEIKNNPPSGDCPEGMAYINKLNGYCIDKYEASVWNADGSWNSTSNTSTWNAAADTDVALANGAYANSSEGKYPWVYIDQTEARTACANYPSGNKYLCTSEEWLAASNVKGAYYNLATILTDCTVDETRDCDWADSPGGGNACMTGSKTDCVSSEGVYDMTGNVYEWTNETVGYTKPCEPVGTSGYCYWNGTAFTNSSTQPIYGNDGVYFLDNSVARSGYAVRRGGLWNNGAFAGPFCANLHYGPTGTGRSIGFRCCSS